MNLKEAFRYQNFLDNIYLTTFMYLSETENIMEITREHMRNIVNSGAIDEIKNSKDLKLNDYDNNKMIDFIVDILNEKIKLYNKIDEAKSKCEFNIDSAVAINKKKQNLATLFTEMGNRKASETITTGTDYKFNNDGVQNLYRYNIKEIKKIDFDRNKVKAISKKLLTESDKTSSKIESELLNIQVDYKPIYDINDTYDDIIERYINN